MRAASSRTHSPYQSVTVYCDNQGVLRHGNSPNEPLLVGIVSCYLKQLLRDSLLLVPFQWVEGHTFEVKGWKSCNLEERLNHKVDRLAKAV